MEKDRDAIKILKENIKQTDASACEIFSGDSFVNMKSVVSKLMKNSQQAYFYIDPPFNIREGMEDIYDNMINMIASIPKEVVQLIIIEHMTGLDIPQTIGSFVVKKSKKFGNTSLSYLQEELT